MRLASVPRVRAAPSALTRARDSTAPRRRAIPVRASGNADPAEPEPEVKPKRKRRFASTVWDNSGVKPSDYKKPKPQRALSEADLLEKQNVHSTSLHEFV